MAGRSPARFLAPLALAAFVLALFLVVTSSNDDGGSDAEPNQATETRPASEPDEAEETDRERERDREPRRYTVQPGDTPSGIAEETGVSLEEILRLNPELDPQALTPGTRIRLREREQ